MKYKVKVAITSFLILILSVMNIRTGLVFKTTDNTERDAKYTSYTEISTTKEKTKIEVKTANIPKPAAATYSYSGSETSGGYKKSGKDYVDCTNYNNVLGTLSINDRNMTVVEACLVYDGGSYFIITPSRPGYVAKYGSLIYAHNTASGLGDLSRATNIVFNDKSYHRTDINTVTRAQANRSMSTYVQGFPKLYLMTCAGTNYGNGDASHRLVAGFSK